MFYERVTRYYKKLQPNNDEVAGLKNLSQWKKRDALSSD